MFHHVYELCNSHPVTKNKKTGKHSKQVSDQPLFSENSDMLSRLFVTRVSDLWYRDDVLSFASHRIGQSFSSGHLLRFSTTILSDDEEKDGAMEQQTKWQTMVHCFQGQRQLWISPHLRVHGTTTSCSRSRRKQQQQHVYFQESQNSDKCTYVYKRTIQLSNIRGEYNNNDIRSLPFWYLLWILVHQQLRRFVVCLNFGFAIPLWCFQTCSSLPSAFFTSAAGSSPKFSQGSIMHHRIQGHLLALQSLRLVQRREGETNAVSAPQLKLSRKLPRKVVNWVESAPKIERGAPKIERVCDI